MKKIIVILLALYLVGCQSTSSKIEPVFSTDILEISSDELSNYWVPSSTKPKALKKRPDWLPEGKGEWTVKTVIDSNGNVVEKTLVSSNPEGFMTQNQIDEMPKTKFEVAASNKNRIPVMFYGTAKIAPRNEL